MNNLSVMLIEDNCDDAELAVMALKKAGIAAISIARDGQEAIQMLMGESDTVLPDLILLDLKLPKMHGREVLRRIRADERTRFIKVAVLTSADDPQSRQACHDLAVAAYLTKPLAITDAQWKKLLV